MPEHPVPPDRIDPRPGLSGLEQRVLGRWRALPAPRDTVIVGFSGGADSLALAALLARLAGLTAIRPVLVHVDHGWRAGSAAEQTAAGSLAAVLRLPFCGHRLADPDTIRHRGVGLEEAARRERYVALAAVAAAHQTDLIALAHHAEDQAETVLLHLLRGTGTSGLAGMRQLSTLALPYWERSPASQVRLWRPLLTESRGIVRAYAARLGLTPVPDPSNEAMHLRRNRLRRDVLPVLEAIHPGAVTAMARGAALAADDGDFLDGLAQQVFATLDFAGGELPRAGVLAQPLPLRRRLVRLWLAAVVPLLNVTADRTDAMLTCLDSADSGRRLELGAGLTVVRTKRGLRLELALAPAAGEGDE